MFLRPLGDTVVTILCLDAILVPVVVKIGSLVFGGNWWRI